MTDNPELQSDILDALSTLTGKTPGDIHYQIKDGKFKELAIEALLAFSRDFYMMDRKEDSEPVDDTTILRYCLMDLRTELAVATDPVQIADIKADIANLEQRLEISQS